MSRAPDSLAPSTAALLPVYNGPEEDGLIGFLQEHERDFEAFDLDKVLLGRFAAFPSACDAIWADCQDVVVEKKLNGRIGAAAAAAIAAYEKSGRMLDAALAWAVPAFRCFR